MRLNYKKKYTYVVIVISALLSIGLLLYIYSSSKNTISAEQALPNNPRESVTTPPIPNEYMSTTLESNTNSQLTTTTSMNERIPERVVTISSTALIPHASVPQTHPMELMAWIYPYKPACDAVREYSDGRNIDILKPEFFTINGGSLILLDASRVPCNGYSPEFVLNLKKHSTYQFVTVSSASAEDMASFLREKEDTDTSIETLVAFVVENNLTGIELNFEDFGSWSSEDYTAFKTFATHLGNALHEESKQLMIVGPPISNTIEEAWFVWRYEDFITLPIDRMVVMGYDYQYDYGVGEPIAPLDWLQEVIAWISERYPIERLTIALPSYGYQGQQDTRKITILTDMQMRMRPGYSTAVRDPRSAEMTWQDGKTIYFYQDSNSMQKKRDLVSSRGIHSVSIWHLGGNPWFE